MNFRRSLALPCLALTGLFLGGCHGEKPPQVEEPLRATTWASPVPGTGVANLFKVSDTLYRGSQPSNEGILQLEALGVRTIVNLRSFDDDDDDVHGTRLHAVGIHFHILHAEDEDTVLFLKTATDPKQTPVFVHCQRGIDRTGSMIAAYRIVVQGWTKDEAIREMTQGGFGYDGIFTTWSPIFVPWTLRRSALRPASPRLLRDNLLCRPAGRSAGSFP